MKIPSQDFFKIFLKLVIAIRDITINLINEIGDCLSYIEPEKLINLNYNNPTHTFTEYFNQVKSSQVIHPILILIL